jgi:hypothetical protein
MKQEGLKVYQAINAIQAELAKAGISKNRRNVSQNYSFRGIDDVFNALSPLLAEHHLCILPRVLKRECVERETKNGGALFYTTVEVEFDFVSSEDASNHTVKTFGEAMDSADKSTNKAMSAAYKYAAFQAFAIPTEGDNDADAGHHEVKPAPSPPPRAPIAPSTDFVGHLGDAILSYCNGDRDGASAILKDLTGRDTLKGMSQQMAKVAQMEFEKRYLDALPEEHEPIELT